MPAAHGYAATAPDAPLSPFTFERREPGPKDVRIEIEYCGVCHTDVHMARSEWRTVPYPLVPGHEILGRVTAVGADVTRFAPGDRGAVGCLVDSCRTCPECASHHEQFCQGGYTLTYGAPDRHTGGVTYGGYSNTIVVDEDFVLSVSPDVDPAGTAPLLCAGITTYSPLRHWEMGPGKTLGVVGLGGLGHMAVKYGAAMGAEVVLFTHSPGKADVGRELGAHDVVVSSDPGALANAAGRCDLIIDTASASHDLDAYLGCLRRDGTLVLLGIPSSPHAGPSIYALLRGRKRVAGSPIGGIAETQEMLDFSAEHGITADVEVIRMDQINEAFERMVAGDVRFRFVIDLATLEG